MMYFKTFLTARWLTIQRARRLCQINQSQLLILRTVNITARPQMDRACAR